MRDTQALPDILVGIAVIVVTGILEIAKTGGAVVAHLIIHAQEGDVAESIGYTGIHTVGTGDAVFVDRSLIRFGIIGGAADDTLRTAKDFVADGHGGGSLDGCADTKAGEGPHQGAHFQIHARAGGIIRIDGVDGAEIETVRIVFHGRLYAGFRHVVLEVDHTQVGAEVEDIGHGSAHVQEHIIFVACPHLAVILVDVTREGTVPVGEDLFRHGRIFTGIIFHRTDNPGLVGGHGLPGGAVVLPPAATEYVFRYAGGVRGQRSGKGSVAVGTPGRETVGEIVGGIAHQTEGPAGDAPAAVRVVHARDAEVGELHPEIIIRDSFLEAKRHVGPGQGRTLCERRGQGKARGEGDLSVGNHGAARRIEGEGAQVPAQGCHGVAKGHGTGGSAVMVIGKQVGVLPALRMGLQDRYGQEGRQEKQPFHIHLIFYHLSSSAAGMAA